MTQRKLTHHVINHNHGKQNLSDFFSFKIRLFLLFIFTIMLAGLFILGAQPFAAGLFKPPMDKVVHVIFFSLLTTVLWLGSNCRNLIAVFAVVVMIAILDEWHQYYLPGRSADVYDLIADILAIAIMILILYLIRAKLSEKLYLLWK